jgi:dipeptidyl-peptidase 4
MVRFTYRKYSSALPLLLIFLAAVLPATAQHPSQASETGLSVEKIYARTGLSQPLASGVAWSPDGKLLSFLQTTGIPPKTDLWAIDPSRPNEPPRLLADSDKLRELLPASHKKDTQATGLGRVAPQRYEWAPSGQALLFIGDDNLYWYDLETKAARRLLADRPEAENSEIADARISPDGKWVSFLRDHDLWLLELASGRELQLTRGGWEDLRHGELDWVYPEELELHQAYWWSPDSAQIAFLEMDERPVTKYPLVDFLTITGETTWEPYPKAGAANPVVRLGVMQVPSVEKLEVTPRWMDTGADPSVYLARVNWLPDSRHLAIQRLPRSQRRLDLLLADSQTGRARVLLSEEDPHWINLSDDLYFFPDGERFLWSSESSSVPGARSPNPGGFRHLYLYNLDGKLLKQLTRGDWVVSSVDAVDPERGNVYLTSTEASVRERHLYRVAIDSGEMERLTLDAGTHGVLFSPDTRSYVDTYSSVMTPPAQYVQDTGTARRLAHARLLAGGPSPALETMHLLPVEWLSIAAAGDTLLQALVIRPGNFDPAKKYPAIVRLYGGPHEQLVVDAWGGRTFLYDQLLAQKGFVIFTVDNRGSYGRGHAFEAPIDRHFGEVELADQLAGVAWLKRQPYVDGSRIGVWGWSFGGYMTLTAMFHAADVFKAGFAGSPVTNWGQYDTIYTERYMGTPQENPEGYRDSSPVNFAANLRGKLLIAAGTDDDNVHFGNTAELAEALINAGRYAELQLYPGRGHGISDQAAELHLFRRVLEFFLDNL